MPQMAGRNWAPRAAVLLAMAVAPLSAQSQPQRALLDKFCVGCHNQRLKTAGLMLDQMDVANPPAGAEVWEKVIRKFRGGMMPPAGMARPDKAATDGFLSYL